MELTATNPFPANVRTATGPCKLKANPAAALKVYRVKNKEHEEKEHLKMIANLHFLKHVFKHVLLYKTVLLDILLTDPV